jgi:hypothetical protein
VLLDVNSKTKARQWRRPEAVCTAVAPLEMVQANRRMSMKRRSSIDLNKLSLQESQGSDNTDPDASSGCSGPQPAKIIEAYRKRGALILNEKLTRAEEIDDDMKETVSYMIRLANQSKVGYLSKQSKLMGRWRKRYFLLYEAFVCYFDSRKEFDTALLACKGSLQDVVHFLKPEKVFKLTGACITHFTNTDLCFSLSVYSSMQAAMDEAIEPWHFLASDEK